MGNRIAFAKAVSSSDGEELNFGEGWHDRDAGAWRFGFRSWLCYFLVLEHKSAHLSEYSCSHHVKWAQILPTVWGFLNFLFSECKSVACTVREAWRVLQRKQEEVLVFFYLGVCGSGVAGHQARVGARMSPDA